MKVIELTKGYRAIVDDEDYEELSKFRWRVQAQGHWAYGVRSLKPDRDGCKGNMLMHRQIIMMHQELLSDQQIDHINHDTLDNRKENLRVVSNHQNRLNCRKHRQNTTSRFKGVYWHKQIKMWHVRIKVNHKQIDLGLFKNELAAALAYNEAATRLHGEFACLNDLSTLAT